MKDGIRSRAARIARALAHQRGKASGIGLRYKRADYRIVSYDETLGNRIVGGFTGDLNDVEDDVLLVQFRVVEQGQFLPNPKTHCMDGTVLPYDVLNEEGVAMFHAAHTGGVVLFNQEQQEAAAAEHRKWVRMMNPPPEFRQAQAVDEAQGQVRDGTDTAPVASFVDEDEPSRLSPEAQKELDEFEPVLKEHHAMNPVKVVWETVQKWAKKEPKPAKSMAMPPVIKNKVGHAFNPPPPGTAWAALNEANRRKRAEHEERKQAAKDEQRELYERLRRETRVT